MGFGDRGRGVPLPVPIAEGVSDPRAKLLPPPSAPINLADTGAGEAGRDDEAVAFWVGEVISFNSCCAPFTLFPPIGDDDEAVLTCPGPSL